MGEGGASAGAMKTLSLSLLTIHGTIMPLLVHYSRVRDLGGGDMYLSTVTVFLNELTKLIICFAVLVFYVDKDLKTYCVVFADASYCNLGNCSNQCSSGSFWVKYSEPSSA